MTITRKKKKKKKPQRRFCIFLTQVNKMRLVWFEGTLIHLFSWSLVWKKNPAVKALTNEPGRTSPGTKKPVTVSVWEGEAPVIARF